MPLVKFTQALKRFYPNLEPLDLEVTTVKEVIEKIEEKHPGISSYLVNDQGELRKHVNIFVDGNMIKDRQSLSDPLNEKTEVYIMQALSGG